MKSVRDSIDFVTSINGNTKLQLLSQEYNLDGLRVPYNKKVYFRDTFTGHELLIKRIDDLYLKGQGRESEITTESTYSCVLCFEDCRDITIESIKLGHSAQPGECTGDVLTFKDCCNVVLDGLDIYGCGATGLALYECQNVVVDNCIIHDCTDAILGAYDCENVTFNNCLMTNNRSKTINLTHCNNVAFNKCKIINNESSWFYENCSGEAYVFYIKDSCGNIILKECEVDDSSLVKDRNKITVIKKT